MAKGKKIEAEFQLPEPLIQHIQSFLSGKEAARTTVLSKSWYAAWLTRPNFDFDEMLFIRPGYGRYESRFLEFVNKTLLRYEELNLKIESLSLNLVVIVGIGENSVYSLANRLIPKAIEMGAIDIDFNNYFRDSSLTFPIEVLGSENLIKLSVAGCKFDLGENGKVSCSRLESLSLVNVYLKGDTIWNIISTCPFIEKLSLNKCFHLFETQSPAPDGVPIIRSRLMFGPFIESSKHNVGSIVDRPSIMHVFCNLKCLFLSWIDIDALLFDDFSSKFPCLKDLTLHHCGIYKRIQISSPSLECINFAQDKMLRAKFDVPRIRKFTFSGSNFPQLLFETTSSNWESDISIERRSTPSTLWFRQLNKLLTNLSQSKVSLFLRIQSDKSYDLAGNESLQGLAKPEVENLTVCVLFSVCHPLFDCLLRCCRPIYVNQYGFLKSYGNFMKFVYERVIKQVKVGVEYFDHAVSVWRPHLLDASTSPGGDELKIRLHLRWDP